MKFKKYKKSHFKSWVKMAIDLWPDYQKKELKKALINSVESDKHEVFFAEENKKLVGFIIVSMRTDYVEGAISSPVGYVEGIYVKPKSRKEGVARKLLQRGEKWILEMGGKQVGSDTWEWNKSSIKFHKKIGFKKEDTLVHFIKDIKN